MDKNTKLYISWIVGAVVIFTYGFVEIEHFAWDIRWFILSSWIGLGAIVFLVRLWRS